MSGVQTPTWAPSLSRALQQHLKVCLKLFAFNVAGPETHYSSLDLRSDNIYHGFCSHLNLKFRFSLTTEFFWCVTTNWMKLIELFVKQIFCDSNSEPWIISHVVTALSIAWLSQHRYLLQTFSWERGYKLQFAPTFIVFHCNIKHFILMENCEAQFHNHLRRRNPVKRLTGSFKSLPSSIIHFAK